jgi:DNA-directed RNA polymerase subunit alpha
LIAARVVVRSTLRAVANQGALGRVLTDPASLVPRIEGLQSAEGDLQLIDMMLPKVETKEAATAYGRYQIEPLEPGFGATVGNAMRRVLLAALPGAAVTSIRIDNVYHEFSDIPHVKEDTTELLLNVKQIRVRSFTDRPVQMRIEAAGAGVVTAADVIAPPDVEIVNPELHLATLDSSEARLNIDLTVERGKGYQTGDHRDGLPIGVIPVDAIFTPVRKVNYSVETTRVGQVTNYERLVLDVWTDGTINPDDAVSQAANILVRHLTLFTELVRPSLHADKAAGATVAIPQRLYEMPIEDLNLSVRAYNCLKRAGITKVGQILEMSEDDLLGVRNFGRKSLDELRERLAAHGLLEHSRLGEESSAAAGEGEGSGAGSAEGESDYQDEDELDEEFADDEFEDDYESEEE